MGSGSKFTALTSSCLAEGDEAAGPPATSPREVVKQSEGAQGKPVKQHRVREVTDQLLHPLACNPPAPQ
eukprot:9496552-Pyramimonas_sp.AAC.1